MTLTYAHNRDGISGQGLTFWLLVQEGTSVVKMQNWDILEVGVYEIVDNIWQSRLTENSVLSAFWNLWVISVKLQ